MGAFKGFAEAMTVHEVQDVLTKLCLEGHGDKELSIRAEYCFVKEDVPEIGEDYVDFYGAA